MRGADDTQQSDDEARIVHLAVHPTAWTTKPPECLHSPPLLPVPSPFSVPAHNLQTVTSPAPTPTIPANIYQTPPPQSQSSILTQNTRSHPLFYVICRHQDALLALSDNIRPEFQTPRDDFIRSIAVQTLEWNGYAWPAILDEEFPPWNDIQPGVKYERITIE